MRSKVICYSLSFYEVKSKHSNISLYPKEEDELINENHIIINQNIYIYIYIYILFFFF